jgi:hypothetical protein
VELRAEENWPKKSNGIIAMKNAGRKIPLGRLPNMFFYEIKTV